MFLWLSLKSIFLTEQRSWADQVELSGRNVLLQGSNWESAAFQKPSGRARNGKVIAGARSLADGGDCRIWTSQPDFRGYCIVCSAAVQSPG